MEDGKMEKLWLDIRDGDILSLAGVTCDGLSGNKLIMQMK